MKNIYTLLFLLFIGFGFAQMPNIETVWYNDGKPYFGEIDTNKQLKLKINLSEQNKKNDQQYFLSGYTLVNDTNYTKFEGDITITKYKSGAKRNSIYGEYELAEEPGNKHTGVFTGKFIYTFKWNKKTEKIESQFIQFLGDWKSYDGTLNYKTSWKNN
ncbi:MAG: hypothetical protein Q4G16_11960 [Cruoricaptor ignavus]|nr:hypothetical protein [Cruoricaptor ignavus]